MSPTPSPAATRTRCRPARSGCRDGDTLISDQFNDRVIEVNRSGDIVRQEGNLNSSGYSTTTTAAGLNAPYDAKVIGDYTGLTPPLGVMPER